jgi:hypothetical protein
VQQVHLLCNASSASQDNGAARDVRLLHDAPRTPAARGGTLIAEALDVSQGAIEWVKSEGSEGLKDRRAAVGGGAQSRGGGRGGVAEAKSGGGNDDSRSRAARGDGRGGRDRFGSSWTAVPPVATSNNSTLGSGSSSAACGITRNAAHLRQSSSRKGVVGAAGGGLPLRCGMGTAVAAVSGAAGGEVAPVADLAPTLQQAQVRAARAQRRDERGGAASGDTECIV